MIFIVWAVLNAVAGGTAATAVIAADAGMTSSAWFFAVLTAWLYVEFVRSLRKRGAHRG